MAFKDIIGHEKQRELLLSFVEKERLPQAFLFAGQEGIGKKKVALEFAGRLFCARGDGCGLCPSCVKTGKGIHPDLKVLEGKTSIGIDEIRGNREKKIRGINQEVFEPPYESSRRVIVIDNAHMMTHEAANALLKTLEEPPPYNLFILVTSAETRLPMTIRSRCTKVHFSPLSEEDVGAYFASVPGLAREMAGMLAKISYGSIGCGCFWAAGENMALRKMLAEYLLGRRGGFVNTSLLVERVVQNPGGISFFLYFVLSLLGDLYRAGEGGDRDSVVNLDVRDLIDTVRIDRSWIISSIKKVRESLSDIRYNVNKWLLIENLLIEVTERKCKAVM